MTPSLPASALQLRSHVKSDGVLELSLADVPLPEPGPDEVLIRVEATPINPSDLGLLVGAVDMTRASMSGTADRPVVTAPIPENMMRAMAARVDQSLPVGNEGAGVVVKAGSSDAAQAMMGKTVSVLGGEMYAQYRCLNIAQCMVLPDGVTPAEGASCYVNPLTSLGMTETMRMEGHTGLVHTAAASNLGQMLVKICKADSVPLVNIVRKPEQEALLRGLGAEHVVDSSKDSFRHDLVQALAATGATLGFDAIGGGSLAGQIVMAMEAAATLNAKEYSRYGSSVHKQVYIYGRLDLNPTILPPGLGMAWGVGGWLLTPFLQKIGTEGRQKLRNRVLAELRTTFASHYTAEISLAEALDLPTLQAYNRRATGEKFLINPNKGL
ncbi:MAG: zinc-binding dehydrogenase [Alphaproteobacteria bacterium]